MKAVVVYESMYGNTHVVADAVGDGLRGSGEVVVVPVAEVDAALATAPDLLVVGGPTHVHCMTRRSTRKAAVEAAAKPGAGLTVDPAASGPGVRDWLDSAGSLDLPAAAFDTRIDAPPTLTGRAAKGIARKLRRHGCRLVAEPESFLVTKESHLEPDEEDRAREWGARLAAHLTPAAAEVRSAARCSSPRRRGVRRGR